MEKYTLSYRVGNISMEARPKFAENLEARPRFMRNGVFCNTLILAKPLLKEDAVYCINMDEFWHHSLPYVHKILVMYLTNLITGSQALIYAKSACPKSKLHRGSDQF
ncbi:uncharacterized protein LOC124459724 [Drosophila willistoni]|uniref:uncharacterized protein LOC124459724 n=1 Tax=Drosophila willistoni TaxID=7260 RepID=UPI001F07ED53|nr:uncharacterized protein LOC124459724 [Drosophila willistoni]